MNSRGEKLFSAYWVLIIIIISIAASYLVISYYEKPSDIRGVEASFLINQVADCLTFGSTIKQDVLVNEKFSEKYSKDKILETCNLNFADENSNTDQYYLEINIYRYYFKTLQKSDFYDKIQVGNPEIPSMKIRESAVYLTETLYTTNENGNKAYLIKISGGIIKTNKNENK